MNTPTTSSKPPSQTRIAVAMSGGVDSSVTAALLAEQGYDVVGLTLQLYDYGAATGRKGACCAGQDIYDARQVADRLNIPHYVLDYESRFSQSVMEDFAASYMRGETPIPCVRCNQRVKFQDMLAAAKDLGAEALATGHYVRRHDGPQGPELHRGTDPTRDQSYFLFTTTKQQLDFLRFPLGALSKPETRALAERFGLAVAAKPDSQDICFVPDGDYASVVKRLRPEACEAGDIVDAQGHVLGRHEGIVHYTVGQRRGLDLSARAGENNAPLYVLRIDAARRHVVVGPRSSLARQEVFLREINWLGDDVPENGLPVTVKLRSAQPPLPALFFRSVSEPEKGRILLNEATFGIAPGQAGVVYQGDRLLGGGWITA
ncbi:MAG: tRNA 2-thiouridine(34) synthase MnmA [Bdellovibrionales bacterium]